MGLDDFKTEGPRKRKSKNSSNSKARRNTIHIVKGVDLSEELVPPNVTVHTAAVRETLIGYRDITKKDVCVCDKCKCVAQDLEALIKRDKLNFRRADWYDTFANEVLTQANKIPREQKLDDLSLEARQNKETADEDEELDPTPSTGLESFKS